MQLANPCLLYFACTNLAPYNSDCHLTKDSLIFTDRKFAKNPRGRIGYKASGPTPTQVVGLGSSFKQPSAVRHLGRPQLSIWLAEVCHVSTLTGSVGPEAEIGATFRFEVGLAWPVLECFVFAFLEYKHCYTPETHMGFCIHSINIHALGYLACKGIDTCRRFKCF